MKALRAVFPRHHTFIAGWLWVSLLAAGAALPAETAAHTDQEAYVPAGDGDVATPGHPQTRRQALSIGFFLVGCLIVGGTILLALVVLWGNRTRRLVRSPLPPVAKRDELWFLKAKKDDDDGLAGEAREDPEPEAK